MYFTFLHVFNTLAKAFAVHSRFFGVGLDLFLRAFKTIAIC
jgi:hypothetical protein